MAVDSLLLFAAGLALLTVGAESLVRGAARLAATMGISSLIVGLTVVAFGTSAPEAVVSLQAALAGRADIALGNVVGSNIFNVLVILGLSAVVAPLVVSDRLVRHDVPIVIGLSSLVMLLAADGTIDRLEGVGLVALLGAYILFLIWIERRLQRREESADAAPRASRGRRGALINGALVLGGLVLLVIGSRFLVDGAVAIARMLGLSELVIGLTIVAAGTSLPELATSIVAAARKEQDIAVGNIVGSNIFNLLMVLGGSAAIVTGGIPVPAAAFTFDMPVMIAVAIACLPVFFVGLRISRWEGAIFVFYYIAYVVFLVLDATSHTALPIFSVIMLLFVVPLTVLTFSIVLIRHRAAEERPPSASQASSGSTGRR
ncbi:MAG: calcium/sodium antiporter [Gemmatimonadetes bacterium]|nr:calcium/sodium antiporter [Gemmatimonadota bacterium]